MKALLIGVTALLVLTGNFLCSVPLYAAEQDMSTERSAMQMYVDNLHPGWNLGNTFDAPAGETAWGNPKTTKELIDAIAVNGFRSIRIPVTWDRRIGSAPDYKIDPVFMERVAEVVDWSLDAGMYVMLNMHHDTSWIFHMDKNYDEIMARYSAVWKQIADHFKDYPLTLMFEGLNEPRFSDDWGEDRPEFFEYIDALYTSFHEIVRQSGGNNDVRPLVFSTMTAAPTEVRLQKLAETMDKLNDSNIIATIHYYGYYPFSVNVAGATKFDNNVRLDIVGAFERAHRIFVSRGIPVIIGEFGLLGFDKHVNTIQRGEMLKFFEYVTYYAQEKEMPLMLWDNGQHYQRRQLKWADEGLYNVIMVTGGRSSYTNSDSIFLRKGQEIKNRSLLLELNGNELVSITLGEQPLTEGTEYTLTKRYLTFSAEFLKGLVEKACDRYGTIATLTCHFSHGAPWDVHIILYDMPVMEDTEGRTGRFRIPTAFNGDRLATMEAVYTEGGNAGPNDWTSYKEFNLAFRPNYEDGYIEITPAFFKETHDGEVLLRMHFWSGAIVEYYLEKQGAAVVGKSTQ